MMSYGEEGGLRNCLIDVTSLKLVETDVYLRMKMTKSRWNVFNLQETNISMIYLQKIRLERV